MPDQDPTIAQAKQRFFEKQKASNYEDFLARVISVSDFPDRLFHYTSAGGLLGIIECQSFWFTDIAYLNDSMEFRHGLRCFTEALQDCELHSLLAGYFSSVEELLTSNLHCQVVCFCELDDLLTQWNGYGNQGNGYSIGLTGSALAEIITGKKIFAGPVQYDSKAATLGFVNLLHAGNEAIVSTIKELEMTEGQKKAFVQFAATCIRSSIWITACFIKDSAFEGEREWRLLTYRPIFPPSPELKFRVKNNLLIPYVPVKMSIPGTKVLPLSTITLGPTAHPMATESIKELLVANGMYSVKGQNVKLRRSSVPLQSF